MDIYLTASQFGKYPGLATDTEVNNCYILFLYVYKITVQYALDIMVMSHRTIHNDDF